MLAIKKTSAGQITRYSGPLENSRWHRGCFISGNNKHAPDNYGMKITTPCGESPETKSQNGLDCFINGSPKLTVGIQEAARLLSVSPGSIRKMIRQRRLPRISGIRKILVPVVALQNFVNESLTLTLTA